MNMLLSDEDLTQKDVFGVNKFSNLGSSESLFGSNPFYTELFEYDCDSYGYDAGGLHIMKGYINFNPATGAYKYKRAQNQDIALSPEDWPEFDYHLMYDKDGQHDMVLNLFFREQLHDEDAFDAYSIFSAGSGEWDANMKYVLYPHNLPENEARAFLRSMGEEALKTKISELINELDSTLVPKNKEDYTSDLVLIHTKSMTIEVFFYGIDIATYQNGEIILKL